MNKTKKNVLLMAAMTLLLVMGTAITPMQSNASEEHKKYGDSKSSIKSDTDENKKGASQKMDQDNFCYRGDDDCQQANQGHQIVGKDNDAKGFNDQSLNVEQAATPTATPTPTPTATPITSQSVEGNGQAEATSSDSSLNCPNGSASAASIQFEALETNGVTTGTFIITTPSFGDKSGTINQLSIDRNTNTFTLAGTEAIDQACSTFAGGIVPNPITIRGQCATDLPIRFIVNQLPQNPVTGFPPFAESATFTGDAICSS